MYFKTLFFIFAIFLISQAVLAAPEDKAQDGKDVLGDLTKNVNTIIHDTFQVEKVWESITTNLKDFGEKVQSGAQEFAKSIQKGGNDLLNKQKEAN